MPSAVRCTAKYQISVIDQLLACLDWADMGRFAPAAEGRPARDLISQADKVLRALEDNLL